MNPMPRRKLHPLAMLLLLAMLTGVGILAYLHFGSFNIYVNGRHLQGAAACFSLLGGILVAGILMLCLLAGLGIIALGLLLLVGSLMLFAAAPLLWPLVLVAAIIYLLLMFSRRR